MIFLWPVSGGGGMENVATFDQLLLNQASLSYQLSILGGIKRIQLSYSLLRLSQLRLVVDCAGQGHFDSTANL